MTVASTHESPRGVNGRGPIARLLRFPLWVPLKARDFRLLWAGESISVLGDQFYFVALPWLTLQVSGSAVVLSTVLMAAVIPRTILILFGGAIVDRTSPRLIMLGSNAVRGVAVGILTVLVFSGHAQLWELYVLSFIVGSVGAFFYPAFDSMTPTLFPDERLAAGNALLQGSAQAAGLLGPVLAGIIIAAVGATTGNASAFAVDAASFFVAALALLLMRSGRVRRPRSAGGSGDAAASEPRPGIFGEIKAGIVYVWHNPVLRTILLVSLAAGFSVNGPIEVGLATLAHNRFGSAAAFGVMISSFGVGGLCGTIVGGSLGVLRRRGLVIAGLCAMFAIGMLLIGLAPNPIVASVVIGILGTGDGVLGVGLITWLQASTAEAMMGRVMSVLAFSSFGLQPLSLVLSGAMAQVNVTMLFAVSAALMGVTTLGIISSATMRGFD